MPPGALEGSMSAFLDPPRGIFKGCPLSVALLNCLLLPPLSSPPASVRSCCVSWKSDCGAEGPPCPLKPREPDSGWPQFGSGSVTVRARDGSCGSSSHCSFCFKTVLSEGDGLMYCCQFSRSHPSRFQERTSHMTYSNNKLRSQCWFLEERFWWVWLLVQVRFLRNPADSRA